MTDSELLERLRVLHEDLDASLKTLWGAVLEDDFDSIMSRVDYMSSRLHALWCVANKLEEREFVRLGIKKEKWNDPS